ncbi:MAG: acetyl-CoA carboxylase carboxyltransferase subunit alpha [Alphaproteobacteria bacterium]|jgi:acetyl-CoA carboxylase carboxyl transferase subunit alpha|nr:acetyl-CoA carboxylase carboxyltransferase subunit alpha [Alphaproteobacteria bacterium]MBT4082475.1 acetyl-CoA carboxylase carboxyltransferase subunit alpha [Alphaproteobacteria bacterium]MBT4545681.1 acetyl-CoA carboxylase carboxyltransferase subunit alpha [Alphaproteobacteria bacterium]MBT7745121.1 acetyl-CoA carboxylase carboxyltransferase subunit alpha [Alphaproteobacteria bacterium]
MNSFLDFEKPLADLEGKLKELKHLAEDGDVDVSSEIAKLESRSDMLLRETYEDLGAWQKTQVARHADRPHYLDYVAGLIDEFTSLAGDRGFGEDKAILGGLGRFRGRSVMVIGQEKGSNTADRIKHNFGMAQPEGYRKAVRLMKLAEQNNIPVITFVDTAGAHPGVEAEERGQAEAIARSIDVGLSLKVPFISIVIGEGGSGGAIALAAGNVVIMLEHAIYSVITPEGCASILWRSGDKARDAAEAMKLTAQDLLKLGVIDTIVKEPLGGAHRGAEVTIKATGDALAEALDNLIDKDGDTLRLERRQKFLDMGRAGIA